LVILALGFLMPALSYIPQTVLAAVIITSVVFLIEWHEIRPMWKGRSES
jgi:sodium-independent sulfate anion transporter 11